MKNFEKGIFIGINKNIDEPVKFIEYYDKLSKHKNICELGKIGTGINFKIKK
ncbi:MULTISPECIES: hypothetical protein [Clostridium]|uniref:Uncharacterized protein n=1 Tax=Clostridium botulinum TaxID=1491 RepID=A0A077K2W3_CLOBO|nr:MULTISPECIES: hypothetical protein [Clostridium]AJD29182.1 hypothetical protein T258_3942 [Clostridium botulinum Prevot_594]BAP25828.1 hypothetical protein [Clostridium botulinum]